MPEKTKQNKKKSSNGGELQEESGTRWVRRVREALSQQQESVFSTTVSHVHVSAHRHTHSYTRTHSNSRFITK